MAPRDDRNATDGARAPEAGTVGETAASGGPRDSQFREEDVHVLLVDDDEAWATSTAQILEHQREAFTVRTATELATASELLSDETPDCVVSDYQLGHGTGLDLLREVRETAPELPFILITGRGDERLASDAIGEQVTDYIPKRSLGGRDDLLARRIESEVDSHRTRQTLARERRSKEAMLNILTATTSREGLARRFSAHLVEDRGYDCAWIGITDRSRGVVPQASAGRDGYLDAAIEPGTTPGGETEPAFVALARRDLHVVAPIDAEPPADENAADGVDAGRERPASDGVDGEWRRLAVDYGFGGAAAVPIAHDGTVFGVLAAYTAAEAIDPGERALLREHGETIGYALRSAGWKASLLSTAPVAVELEITDDDAPLVALDSRLPEESRIEVLTAVPHEDHLLCVTRLTGATPDELRAGAGGVAAIRDTRVEGEREQARAGGLQCEFVVSPPSPEQLLAEHGGRIVEAAVEEGRATITVASPEEHDVQSLIAAVERSYPGVGVRSVRSGGEPAGPVTADDLRRSLTDRQQQAVELAFYEGYFERPREHNTTEVAEKLGVSRPTFTQHLRAAQRKLLGRLLKE
jgi:DNA-binding response OmpR family regulator